MTNGLRILVVSIGVTFFLGFGRPAYTQNSVLKSGQWYKVAISKTGVYKIDATLLKKMGFSPSKIDPRKIKVYGNVGGMLPQANNNERPQDLIENSIYVKGKNDGVFNSSDYVLFYAQGPDQFHYDLQRDIFFYEKNLYADRNYYFVTVAEDDGKRITTAIDLGTSFPEVNQFENFVYYELDQYNELKSGREWYGELFDLTTEFSKSFTINNIVPGSNIKLVTDVMAKSFIGSYFNVSINGQQVVQQIVSPIPNTQYGIKGRDKSDTVVVSADLLSAPSRSSQEVKYQYVKGTGYSVGRLDYFLLQATQKLALYGKQTSFRSTSSLLNATSTFKIDETTSQSVVWDVTNPYEPIIQPVTHNSSQTTFATPTTSLKEFVVFDVDVPTPELKGKVTNQDIHGSPTPSFLIVTHPDFKEQAQRLANHRNTVSNLSTLVLTTDEVYNEFSSGRQDITAIRDVAKFFYDKSPGTLKAMLLFGKGSYDYKDHLVDNKNFVPIYESRNSLHPLLTYSSDDYFGFLENNEGDWGESPVANYSMDIAIGRIPAKNSTDATNAVDKIIQYDTNKSLVGSWHKEFVFVADDGDYNLHQEDANSLADAIENTQSQFMVKKLFLDKYPQVSKPSGEISPEMSDQIENTFNRGALVINYTGHGGERVWAQEKIFDDLMIQRLENERLPLLVTATCEFGRQDDPVFASGAELCMMKKSAGAIGLVTTSRPVNSATNFLLNQAFYNAFFQKENNHYLSLGEIFRRTKNASSSGVSNRNFSLIGDPTLHLAIPELNIKVTEIKTGSGDTDLKALSVVTVKGIVTDENDDLVSGFNGELSATLFDKETSFVTLGNENQPYPFNQWYNAIFRGQASIINGSFEFQFVVPKNIAYTIGEGKLSLYGFDSINNLEAVGYSENFSVGSSEPNPTPDTSSPSMLLYIGDTTFKNGGITTPNTNLLVELSDESGINISGYGIGNSLMATLDNSQTFILNEYYESEVDDYSKGKIVYPLKNLAAGFHTLIVKAWDTYNNPIESSIDFKVTGENGLAIETFGNYPNPFSTSTKIFFTHNRSGDDLQANLILYDNTGQVIASYDYYLPFSTYQQDLIELPRDSDIFANHTGSIYFARLIVRSLSNGSKNERVTKLILLN